MKKIVCLAALLAAAFIVEAAEPERPKIPRSRRQRRTAEQLGGRLMRPYKGKFVRIVNAQQTVDEGVLKEVCDAIMSVTCVPMAVSATDRTSGAAEQFKDDKTAAVVLVKDAESPNTIIVAPENGWCEVNVRPLAAGAAEPGKVKERVKKELWRAVALMLGAGNSNFQPCLMTTVLSVQDLDGVKQQQPCPEVYGKMSDTATRLGCGEAKFTTYKQACREGWAPPPTNDVQKAIWEEIKADKERGPTNPITIPPPNQKK